MFLPLTENEFSAPHWKRVLISFFTFFFVCRTCLKVSLIICSLCAMQIKRHSCKMALGNWFHSPILWNDREYRSKYRQQEDFPSKQITPSNLPGNFKFNTVENNFHITTNGHWEELALSLVPSTFTLILTTAYTTSHKTSTDLCLWCH